MQRLAAAAAGEQVGTAAAGRETEAITAIVAAATDKVFFNII
ncbi:hypothetical protein [Dapis sp. BLCC M229]